MVFRQLHYTKRNRFMPFLLAEILNFQGSTHHIGVGSFSYYLYSNYVAGFFPRSYAMIWFGFTMISPFLAFVCWYAKGKSRPAFMLSVLILAVLFNMTFVYGWGYFEARSVLELIVFIIGLTVLRRDTLKSSVLMGTISIVLAFLLDMVIPFHFG